MNFKNTEDAEHFGIRSTPAERDQLRKARLIYSAQFEVLMSAKEKNFDRMFIVATKQQLCREALEAHERLVVVAAS